MAKLYDVVKAMLIEYPQLRDSDLKLVWNVWNQKPGLLEPDGRSIKFEHYMSAPSSESITRCKRLIVERFPELASSKPVQEFKDKIEDQKGTHVFREQL